MHRGHPNDEAAEDEARRAGTHHASQAQCPERAELRDRRAHQRDGPSWESLASPGGDLGTLPAYSSLSDALPPGLNAHRRVSSVSRPKQPECSPVVRMIDRQDVLLPTPVSGTILGFLGKSLARGPPYEASHTRACPTPVPYDSIPPRVPGSGSREVPMRRRSIPMPGPSRGRGSKWLPPRGRVVPGSSSCEIGSRRSSTGPRLGIRPAAGPSPSVPRCLRGIDSPSW